VASALWADINNVACVSIHGYQWLFSAYDINILVTADESEQFDPEVIKRSILDAGSRYCLRREL
jgi:hypothetical protein